MDIDAHALGEEVVEYVYPVKKKINDDVKKSANVHLAE